MSKLVILIADQVLEVPILQSRTDDCIVECMALINKYRKPVQIQ